jgi:DeoR/GlpR family transcriptional regulator of sugar metabolism
MFQAERRKTILESLHHNGLVTVTNLVESCRVSEMTIRRDLREMEREGLLRRVHGGAVSTFGRSFEPLYQVRSAKNVQAKRAIGQAAARLILDGDCLALDIGTTALEVIRALEDRRNLTIVTASIPIANEIVSRFSLNSEVRLILTGGIVRAGELSMIGSIAEATYTGLHVDKAFLGVGGLSLDNGLTEYNLEDAQVKHVLIKSAQQRIVLADSSKFGRTTFASVGQLSDVNTVITDIDVSKDHVDALRRMGIEVIIAE